MFSLPCALVAQAASGCAVAIGGALKYDNDAVWQRLVDAAGGKGARFAVFASAAGSPERSAASTIKALEQRGAVAEHIPVAVNLKTPDWKDAVRDPALIAKVKSSRGIYFTGGSQERITRVLLEADGKPTPMLQAIRDVHAAGGVIAGSSAGAAILSTTMFNDPRDLLGVLREGVEHGRDIAPGLGFVGPDVFIDQHFLKRGRFARLLPAMVHTGYKLGLGIDENTAAFFCNGAVEIVGFKGALIIDLTEATSNRKAAGFNVKNARLSYLERGDRFDLATRTATPSPQKLADKKIDPNAPGFKPFYTSHAFYPDVLGDTVVANLMGQLIDGKQQEIIGLAFDAAAISGAKPAHAAARRGFEFRFRRAADSVGWYTGAFGGEDYTVLNIYLDVTPVQFNQPLYRKP